MSAFNLTLLAIALISVVVMLIVFIISMRTTSYATSFITTVVLILLAFLSTFIFNAYAPISTSYDQKTLNSVASDRYLEPVAYYSDNAPIYLVKKKGGTYSFNYYYSDPTTNETKHVNLTNVPARQMEIVETAEGTRPTFWIFNENFRKTVRIFGLEFSASDNDVEKGVIVYHIRLPKSALYIE
ncbi:hypothetical protein IJH66_01690 [Candidatus Saccharibacteria bacterium]|nr:hypothetical protein [Candidatus Saccharibacteria bacterium]